MLGAQTKTQTAWAVCAVLGAATGLIGEARAAVVTPPYAASVLTQVAKLGGIPDPVADLGDGFGSAIAVNGDTAAVGAPSLNSTGPRAGGVLVFVRSGSTWPRQAVLLPPGPAEAFGAAIAISGDTLVAGAPGEYSGTGRAYVYVRTGLVWSLQATLGGTDNVIDDGFGAAVAIDGDTLVIGAPRASSGWGSHAGAAYVFVRSGSVWALQQKVLPATLAAEDAFGTAVALAGDTALIGSPGDDTEFGGNSGSAFVFGRSGVSWSERQRLVRAGATEGDAFGRVVALSGSVAAVGAPSAPNGAFGRGVVAVLGWTGAAWTPQAELTSGDSASGFGWSIGLSSDRIAVGRDDYRPRRVHLFRAVADNWVRETVLPQPPPDEDSFRFGAPLGLAGNTLIVAALPASNNSFLEKPGAAFAFAFSGGAWVEEARLSGFGTTSGDGFGSSMSIDGDVMAVGSPSDNTDSGRTSGSVTVFQRTAGIWVATQKLLPDSEDNYQFGRNVSLSGDLLAVSSGADSHGSVYVFRKTSTWSLEQKITVPYSPQAGFGTAVAIFGDTLFVGEPSWRPEDAPFSSGAVSVFVETGGEWLFRQRLLAAVTGQSFGSRIALRGALALVGAPRYGTGTVTVFRRSAGVWSLSQTLEGPTANESFGTAVVIGATEIAVGSPGTTYSGFGSVYLFEEVAQTFSLRQRLVNPGYGAQDTAADFGRGVALGGDLLLTHEDNFSFGGIAFVYERSGDEWRLRSSLRAPASQSEEGFGSAGGVAGAEVLVGAPGASLPEVRRGGAVYVFGPMTTGLTLSANASPASVVQGETVTFEIAVGNDGPAVHPGPIVQLDLDPRLVFSGAAYPSSCSDRTGVPICILPPLAPGESALAQVWAAAALPGTALSSIRILGDGPVAQTTTTILPGPGADVRAEWYTGSTEARRGEYLWYTLILRNLGPGAATGLRVTGSAEGLIDACPEIAPCVIPSLAANLGHYASVAFLVPKDYSGPNPIRNTLTLSTATVDPNLANNTVVVTTPLASTRMLFNTVTPCRLVDTRDPGLGGPGPLSLGPTTYSATSGPCGVSTSARALAVNVTVTEPSSDGFLKAYAAGTPSVSASFVNYRAGQTRSNNGIVGLDADGRFVIEVGQAAGTAHVIVDIVGFFQ